MARSADTVTIWSPFIWLVISVFRCRFCFKCETYTAINQVWFSLCACRCCLKPEASTRWRSLPHYAMLCRQHNANPTCIPDSALHQYVRCFVDVAISRQKSSCSRFSDPWKLSQGCRSKLAPRSKLLQLCGCRTKTRRWLMRIRGLQVGGS